MVIKWGRTGSFLACLGYKPAVRGKKKKKAEGSEPAIQLAPPPVEEESCRNTMEVVKNLDGTWEKVPAQTTDEICDTCGAPMTIKRGRFGSFLACTKYPECKTTKAISLGVKCPRPGCGGFIAEKRSRRGKPFYGCSNWAKKQCDFVAWDRPVPQPCPICNAKFVVKKENKSGTTLRCLECDWKQGTDDTEEHAA
jgi:DNA topoisomerase-1